ncbi:MAG: TerC/Alx family metal homeostasis membrane protein [Acidobacteria bacterium]|nr:TerC/Alx family metal homeostasis membrane protein [Acidobacteriota bacterium]
MTAIEYPFWVWLFFFAVVLVALFVDIGVVNRKSHAPSRKETLLWSAVWVGLALLFAGFIYSQFGAFKSKEFLTGYLIELSLSIDNLFVFLLIFNYFKVPKKYQHRVLFWGIFMALVMRLVMIFAGVEVVNRFHWTLYIAGAFLIYTGIKMFGEDEAFEPEESTIVSMTTRFIRISKHYDGERFFVTQNGRRTGTLLLLVLIVINIADLVFAVDSIPAILGITTDTFIVYTSNIFAILGLRTFFFLLSELADRFKFLKYGLAFILTFIGVKMLLPLIGEGLIMVIGSSGSGISNFLVRYQNHEFEQLLINISLGIVVVSIVISIVLSLIFPPPDEAIDENGEDSESIAG